MIKQNKWYWCTYGWLTKRLGRAKKIGEKTFEVQYYANQMYPTELWDSLYIKIFTNRKKAEEYIKVNYPTSGSILYD
jgi:hypothetical protein